MRHSATQRVHVPSDVRRSHRTPRSRRGEVRSCELQAGVSALQRCPREGHDAGPRVRAAHAARVLLVRLFRHEPMPYASLLLPALLVLALAARGQVLVIEFAARLIG